SGCVAKVDSGRKADADDSVKRSLDRVETDQAALKKRLDDLEELVRERDQAAGDRLSELRDAMMVQIAAVRRDGAAAEGPTKDQGELIARLKEQGVELDPAKRVVRAGGKMIGADMPLEFAITTDRGKTHETLVSVKCMPSALNAGL